MIDPKIITAGLDRIEALLMPVTEGECHNRGDELHRINNARQIVGALKTMIELDNAAEGGKR